jgi:tRNA 2-thiocytidine biosynthesis protein TtcA
MDKIYDVGDEKLTPFAHRFIKMVGKAINKHSMIRENEKVLLSVSGGKDSLALSFALAKRLKWLPISYHLEALMINWQESSITDIERQNLIEFYKKLEIPFTILDQPKYPDSFKGDFNCYLCSRNRRRIFFDWAKENDFKLIAMGHHLDDLVETTLLNLTSRATFSTMLPVQEFFKGSIHVIRPLIEIPEHTIVQLTKLYNFPVSKSTCPHDQTNIRSQLKPIVRSLVKIDKNARQHLYNAHQFSYQIPRER